MEILNIKLKYAANCFEFRSTLVWWCQRIALQEEWEGKWRWTKIHLVLIGFKMFLYVSGMYSSLLAVVLVILNTSFSWLWRKIIHSYSRSRHYLDWFTGEYFEVFSERGIRFDGTSWFRNSGLYQETSSLHYLIHRVC